MLFCRRGEPVDYNGERNAKGIQAWISSKIEPSVIAISSEEQFKKFNERVTIARVVLFAGDDSDLVPVFTRVAESPAVGEFSYGRVSDVLLAEKLGQKMGSVVVFYAHQNPTVYGDEMTEEALKAFLKSKAYPRLETLLLNQAFVNRVTEKQRTMVIAFHENADQLQLIRQFADDSFQDAHFTETQVSAYPELAAQWGASGLKFPTIIVATWKDGHPDFKAFDEEKDLTLESAKQFLSDCIAGTCTPFKKSQPLPTEEELKAENVRPLVGKNFNDVVMDESKDVLVEFYAPWCGHCKAIAPLYEEIATVFKKIDSIVIAKFDATQNYFDPKLNIRGFPTLLLFTANNKAEPIRYEGARDFPSIAKFINENASIKYDSADFSGGFQEPSEPHDEL